MPNVREPLDPKISMWHLLAFYLRFLREKEGLSLTQCGQLIGAARSTVSNMEAGRLRPHDDQMKKLDLRYGTGILLEVLLWYARMAHDPAWLRQFSQYERKALSIKTYHGQVIPHLLQTDDYTWAYVQVSDFKDFAAEQANRVARKRAVLDREDPPDIWALVDESALARPVGGREVMRAQLENLLVMGDLPHVSVRVVPFASGAHLGADGPLQVISVEDRDVAYSGAQGGGRLIESPSEVRFLAATLDHVSAKAESEATSRNVIKQYLERYR
ncbi:Scr1 family TA system antitoxin-like transcriptional regulator [Spirillospora sp. NPDC050679]